MTELILFLAFAAQSTVTIDNDAVRVISVNYQPHDKSALHAHAGNRVVVYLDAGHLTVTFEDGHKEDLRVKAGDALWTPVGPKHMTENAASTPIRFVEIELKKSGAPAPQLKLDPVKLDPKHNQLLFQNDQVRVFRSWREPGGSEKMHEHAGQGRVAVMLTDVHAVVKQADGSTSPLDARAGDVTWSGPTTHSAANTGARRYDMIIVEVR